MDKVRSNSGSVTVVGKGDDNECEFKRVLLAWDSHRSGSTLFVVVVDDSEMARVVSHR